MTDQDKHRTEGFSLSVGDLHNYLNAELADIGDLSVNGVITSWRPHRSRWIRAEIASMSIDGVPTAKLGVAIPPRVRCPLDIAVGAQVMIEGTLQTHPLYNPLQLQARTVAIRSATSPASDRLAAHLNQLTANGRIGDNKRRAVPDPILSVGLVTAASGGAGLNDPTTILATLGVIARHYPTPMMGEGSAQRITAAIGVAAIANDIVLICRGGGATTDLAAFNTVMVVDAILASPVPVITGIGHADDHTAADTVAHHAGVTPTAAAQWVQTETKRRAEQQARNQLAAQQAATVQARNQAATHAQQARVDAYAANRIHIRAKRLVTASIVIAVIVVFAACVAVMVL